MRISRSFRLSAALGLLLAGGQACAQTQVDIPYGEFTLPNGLRVIVHEDHKAPIVAVNVWYHVGSKNERPGRTGFAHLFEFTPGKSERNVQKQRNVRLRNFMIMTRNIFPTTPNIFVRPV